VSAFKFQKLYQTGCEQDNLGDIQTNILKFPHENGMAATTGLTHETPLRAVQANQKSEIGNPKLPIIAGYRRYSGGTIPPRPSACANLARD
jgi:hypothetical protein